MGDWPSRSYSGSINALYCDLWAPYQTRFHLSWQRLLDCVRSWLLKLLQVVNFNQRYAGRVIHAADDRGVGAGRKSFQQRRLIIVGRRDTGGLNLGFLSLFPVIVGGNNSSVR